jgi:hypothetical protein
VNNFIDCTETIKVESIKEEVKDDFNDCGETIKKEDIKGEINEEESDMNPLSIHQETEISIICDDVKEEIEEEESVDDPLFIQEGERSENVNISSGLREDLIDSDPLIVQGILNTGDEENNTVVDNIDIVQHKTDIDN